MHSLLCLLAMLLAACFERPLPDCAFLCGGEATAQCPDEYTCRPDGICKHSRVTDDFSCPGIAPDAAPLNPVSSPEKPEKK
jgi:hypothetical protein